MNAITGKIVDAATGQPVFNAHIVFTDESGKPYSPLKGTVSDPDGNYRFETLGGAYLKATHVSYKSQVKPINMSNYGSGGTYTQVINFSLQPAGILLPEVVIKPVKTWFEKNKLLAYASMAALLGFIVLRKPSSHKKR